MEAIEEIEFSNFFQDICDLQSFSVSPLEEKCTNSSEELEKLFKEIEELEKSCNFVQQKEDLNFLFENGENKVIFTSEENMSELQSISNEFINSLDKNEFVEICKPLITIDGKTIGIKRKSNDFNRELKKLKKKDHFQIYEILKNENYDRNLVYAKFSVYNSLYNDLMLKKLIFFHLSSYVVNQKLCIGQPIKPCFFKQEEKYSSLLKLFVNSHTTCLICDFFSQNEFLPITTNLYECNEFDDSFFLPNWIEKQILFLDEPIHLPTNKAIFYKIFVLGYGVFVDEEQCEKEYSQVSDEEKRHVDCLYLAYKKQFNEQFLKWINCLSTKKRDMYRKFNKLRKQIFFENMINE